MRRASLQEPPGTVRGFLDMIRSPADSASVPSMSLYEVNIAMVSWETKKGKNIGQWTCADIHIQIGGRCRMIRKTSGKWGGELRKHFSKERCSQTAMPFFAVFPLYFGLFLSPVQNQMHR